MKIILSEKQILTTIRLSGTQKAILTKIIASTNEDQAYEAVSDGRNMVAARDILKKIGLIDFEEGSASVTDAGKKVMKDENLIDDSEALTPDGQQFATAENPGDVKKEVPGAATTDTAADAGLEGEPGGEEDTTGGDELDKAMGEGQENTMSLLRQIDESARNTKSIDRLNEAVNMPFTPAEVKLLQMAAKDEGDSQNQLDQNYDLLGKVQEFVTDVDGSWMPYGTQKARDGDPHEWIFHNIEEIVNVMNSHIKKTTAR